MRRAHALVAATVLACSLAAAVATPPIATAATAANTSVVTTAVRPAGVPSVLRFSATTVDGARFDGASLAGRPTLFWFWAPWCGACQSEVPAVRGAFTHYGSRVRFVGVGAWADAASLRAFTHGRGVDGFTELADRDGALWPRFGVIEQPTLVFVHGDGRVETHPGLFGSQADLEAMLARLAQG